MEMGEDKKETVSIKEPGTKQEGRGATDVQGDKVAGHVQESHSGDTQEPHDATAAESRVLRGDSQRKLTEKGAAYRADVCLKRYQRAVYTWRSVFNKAEMAKTICKSRQLKEIRVELDSKMQAVAEAYENYSEILSLIGRESDVSKQFEVITERHEKMIAEIGAQIEAVQNEQDRYSEFSLRSKHSRGSRISGKSTGSEAATKAARLRAKLRHIDLEAEQKLELEKVKLKLHKIRTVKELDMAEAAAEECQQDDEESQAASRKNVNVLANTRVEDYLRSQLKYTEESRNPRIFPEPKQEVDCLLSHVPSQMPVDVPVSGKPTSVPVTQLNPEAPVFALRDQTMQAEIYSLALQSIEATRLPVPEPEVFFGDPLKYPEWKCAFSILIERKTIPAQEKLYYLKKYLGGEAKAVVEGLFFIQNEDAYEKAKIMLEKRFGDPFMIADAFRNKIDTWPRIQSRDSQGLRKFTDFLRQCSIAMSTISNLRFLNDDRENRKLLQKCPEWLVNRWARTVSDYKRHIGSYPSFSDFVDFLEKEADIACEPVASVHFHRDKNSGKDKKQHYGASSFATDTDGGKKPDVVHNRQFRKPTCTFCKGEHYLDSCRDFLLKPVEERKQHVKQSGLCFGCLKPGHKSVECKRKRMCQICGKRHPTVLHGDVARSNNLHQQVDRMHSVVHEEENGVNTHTHLNSSSSGDQKCTMIVPVWVSHRDNHSRPILVYALLDTQSDTTFLLEETSKDLNVKGVEVNLHLSTMFAENQLVKSRRVEGLIVRGYRCTEEIHLPPTYTRDIMPADRSHIPTPQMVRNWPHLATLQDKLEPLMDCKVALLIGYNCPQALVPHDVLVARDNQGPYGQRSRLGWGIVGFVSQNYAEDDRDSIGTSHKILASETEPEMPNSHRHFGGRALFSCNNRVKEVISPRAVAQMFELDFKEISSTELAPSQEDKRFMKILQDGLRKTDDNRFELPLPFKHQGVQLPNNRPMAMKRLAQLKSRLQKCDRLHNDYTKFMEDMLKNGYAERIPESEHQGREGTMWYIPHHCVYQASKPDKIRVVFDASAVHLGQSLNAHLLQGPDMTNSLLGVLCRFRQELIAFTCDIKQMFYQFKVVPEHRDYLRFLWWEGGDIEGNPIDYRMTVHLFGATSSPGCANFCIKQIAEEAREHNPEVAKFMERDFYVDDGITSVPTKEQAIQLIDQTRRICANHGLHLHKFVSNSAGVLQHIPLADLSERNSEAKLDHSFAYIERTLGVEWCVESDTLHFRITLKDRPLTRRGILATVCSLYDPLGFVAPFTLLGKSILQEMCKDQTAWDTPLPEVLRTKWEKWRAEIVLLGDVRVPRCFKPDDFSSVVKTELHHFSDASCTGYGQCSYLRLQDDKGQVHCSLVIGKSRVAPLKAMTIPRLELTAALVSARMSQMLVKEMDYPCISETFWTDSQVVLGYINNDVRRFNIFVANRVQQIREYTRPCQWKYVASKENPADEASRGLSARELLASTWLTGPRFLLLDQIPDFGGVTTILSSDDPEVKHVTLSTQTENPSSVIDFKQFSSWTAVKRSVAVCLKFMDILQSRIQGGDESPRQYTGCTVQELVKAERRIIRLVQIQEFPDEIQSLHHNRCSTDEGKSEQEVHQVKRSSPLYKLNPFEDEEGVLRVGGRLGQGDISPELKHPVILPKKHHISELIVRHYHEKVQHQGRGMTLNEIRNSGYWIVGCTSLVYKTVSRCVTCRRIFRNTQEQKMADLPSDRMAAAPPFTYVASDYFGPWIVKEGRKELKRYGVLFTCMASRAVHLETACSLRTDSFINALRRFVAIRGPIRQLRSDQGTNFVGADNELKRAVHEMDESKIEHFLLQHNCDYIKFKQNVPSASHQGGVWERQIRSVRRVMSILLRQNGSQLCDESLRTFMYEAAAIINSRPLTVDSLNDSQSVQPLCPNNILTMKTNVILPPPGEFGKADMYCKARWRRVQFLVNEFWNRWRKEYLQSVQPRQKWNCTRPDLRIGNIVIVKDDALPRNQWLLARVAEVYKGSDGRVRSVKLAIAQKTLDAKGRRTQPVTWLERPIHKLVLLLEDTDEGTPVGEP